MRFSNSKEFTSYCLVITTLIGLFSLGFSQEKKSASPMAERELQKRRALVEEGEMLLRKGDDEYLAGNFKNSIDAYAGAAAAFPDSPATALLKKAALQRFAQASIEQAKVLVRKGQIEEAKALIDVVLDEKFLPNDPGAIAARKQLDDPVRNNPALTGEHAKDVDLVRRQLYLADGAYHLAKFDEAKQHYSAILKIDPYNIAARSGMERIATVKSKYFNSAYSQTRSEALMEVNRNWELDVKPSLVIPTEPVQGVENQSNTSVPLSNKLSRIIVPQFVIEDATLMEALDLLRLRASENDTFELVPNLKGINFALNLGDPESSSAKQILEKRFNLRVSNVPVRSILKYLTELTGTSFRYDDFAVTITQPGAAGNALISRNYRVPPDFLSNLSAVANDQAVDEEIFNTAPNQKGMLAKRMGAKEALSQQGVSFPDGATANFNPTSNTLLVINTMDNHDIIEQIIDTIVQTEPVIVSVKVTMVKVEKSILEELGFDWMLNDFSLGGSGSGTAQNTGYLSGGTVGSGTAISDLPVVPGVPAPTNPITAGNRSGDGAFSTFGLDELIDAGQSRDTQQFDRAPGIIGVNGVINNNTIQMLMRGLDQNKAADVMATPSITTRSGQAASIAIVKEFIYPMAYDPPALPQSISSLGTAIFDNQGNLIGNYSDGVIPPIVPAFPTDFKTRDFGVFLEVLPTADANRQYIDVALKPVMTDFDGFVNFGSPVNFSSNNTTAVLTQNPILMPVFSVKKIDTSMVIVDGATVVIGGLLKDSVTTVNDKTPVLGDLPVVGRLFQTNGIKHNSTAILFFVNIELVDPTGRPYRNR